MSNNHKVKKRGGGGSYSRVPVDEKLAERLDDVALDDEPIERPRLFRKSPREIWMDKINEKLQ